MTADIEEQENELLALQSIFDSEEFVRDESKSAGELRVSVELPEDFTVALKEDETLRQYEISFLPPLLLNFELPEDYPSSSPPSFTLTCSWLTHTQLSALGAQLTDQYQAAGGAVVLFSWVQFLKEEALRFLDIHTLLELPSDERSTQNDSEDSLNSSLSEPKNNQHTAESGPTDNQSCNVLDPCEPALSAPSLEVEHPKEILSDGQDSSTSDLSRTDSHRVVALIQNTSNDSNHIAQSSDGIEAEQTLQTSVADHQNDLSSAAGKAKDLPFVQPNQSDREGFLNDVSSSDSLDKSEQGAASLSILSREEQTHSGLSLTPSQALLSQLLIYNAAQKQKEFATTVFDCGVCFVVWLGSDCVQLPECGHIYCKTCLAEFCKLQITEGNVKGVTCPMPDCSGFPTPAQVRSLVGEELFSRYDRLLLQSTLDFMADVVYCPRRSCGSAVIVEKASTAAMCFVCSFAFCVTCKRTYHGKDACRAEKSISTKMQEAQQANTNLPQSQEGLKALWDDYAGGSKKRQHLLESRYGRSVMRGNLEDCLSQNWMSLNSKHCPHCFMKIEKNGGCNVMTCSRCGQHFCWACLTRLGTGHSSKHFENSTCYLYQ
ncbi:E3 ubiquitin-protein ligase RNF14-like isoform X2 [Centropristis striata]|uniref:E3 ubiquitin-protein ligase RNF14-like isoform X2 n=1 Tax=Centropristis striata TaxID=184440 RepID=UPI0027DFC7BE|nr:E3 ubiquitin-protein ligase RNF14-like isoform X2 [Centropristis striata]